MHGSMVASTLPHPPAPCGSPEACRRFEIGRHPSRGPEPRLYRTRQRTSPPPSVPQGSPQGGPPQPDPLRAKPAEEIHRKPQGQHRGPGPTAINRPQPGRWKVTRSGAANSGQSVLNETTMLSAFAKLARHSAAALACRGRSSRVLASGAVSGMIALGLLVTPAAQAATPIAATNSPSVASFRSRRARRDGQSLRRIPRRMHVRIRHNPLLRSGRPMPREFRRNRHRYLAG